MTAVKELGLDLTVGGFPGSRGPEFGERGTGSGDDAAGEGDQGEARVRQLLDTRWHRTIDTAEGCG